METVINNSNEIVYPRLCHLKKTSIDQGYGFTIKKTIQELYPSIETIEADSPADSTKLQVNDLIIEINYYNLAGESYNEILKHIRFGLESDDNKINENEVLLLVVDKNTFNDYVKNNLKLNSYSDDKIKLQTIIS